MGRLPPVDNRSPKSSSSAAGSKNQRDAKEGGGGGGGGGGLYLPPVEGTHVIPLIDMAQWSSNLEVKRDAVLGLLSLAESNHNLEVMGKMGALTALSDLMFRPEATEFEGSPKKKTTRFRVVKPGYGSGPLHAEISAASLAGEDSSPGLAAERSRASISAEASTSLIQKVPFKPSKGDIKLQRLAANAISLLVGHPANQKLFLELGYLEKTCKIALSTHNTSIRRSVAVTLLNLSKNPSLRESLFEHPKLMEALGHLALAPDERTRLSAFGVYKRLAQSDVNSENWSEEEIAQLTQYLTMSLDIRLHMMTLDALNALAMNEKNGLVIGAQPDIVDKLASFLDLEMYNDAVRLLASTCISTISNYEGNLPLLGACDMLFEKLHQSIDHGMRVDDYDACRLDLGTIAHVAVLQEVADKLVQIDFVEHLFKYAMIHNKPCRKHAARAIRLINMTNEASDVAVLRNMDKLAYLMCKVNDYGVQMDALMMMAKLSEDEEVISKYLLNHLGPIVSKIEDWGVLPDPDLAEVATKLAANLAQNKVAKMMLTTIKPLIKNLVEGIKSKDPKLQMQSVRFVTNLTEEAEEEAKAAVVNVGAIWRMRSISKDANANANIKTAVQSTLKSSLAEHTAAIMIQSIVRGRIHRKRAKRREERLRQREEERIRKEEEAAIKAREIAEAKAAAETEA